MSRWPLVPLGEVLAHRKEFIEIDDLQTYKRCRVQLHAQGIVLRDAVPGAEIKTKQQQVCRAGEFLVAEIDAKVGGFGIVPEQLAGAIVSSHYFLFGINEAQLDRGFLGYFLRTPAFREQVSAQGSTNYAAIRPRDVLAYVLPLPPLAEQRRLVERIEALAAKVREACGLREVSSLEAHAILPSWLGEFFKGLSTQYPTFPLGQLCSLITDGPHKTPTYVPAGVPFVTVKNMVTGKLDFRGLQFIGEEDHRQIIKRCKPERGDVLYSKDGATRGRPCYVDTDREFNIFVSVALIKPLRNRLEGRYLCHLLNSTVIEDRMISKSRGDMIPHIVIREIKEFPVPTPSPSDQVRIVGFLDAVQARIQDLQKEQARSAAELDALLPAILDRAFNGEL